MMTIAHRRAVPGATTVAAAIALLLTVVLAPAPAGATTCSDPGQGASYGGGTGESDAPYLIATVAHLEALRDRVNGPDVAADDGESQSGCFFLQTADVNVGAIPSWVAIGALSVDGFRGNYNGGYHRIDDLTITTITLTTGTMREGLFGFVRNGMIENLRLEGVSIDLDFDDPDRGDNLYVGALAANLDSSSGETRVERVSVAGSINVDYVGKRDLYVGGVVGRSQDDSFVDDRLVFRGTISGSVDPRSTSSGSTYWHNFGGLVGRTSSNSTLSLGYASAVMDVTVTPKPDASYGPRPVYVGILTGSTSTGTSALSEMYARGSITVTNPSADVTYSGAIGFIEAANDTFVDIYHLDSIVGGQTVSGTFTDNPTYTFAGGQVAGYVGAGVTNVLARTDAQMSLAQPSTTMTGTSGRWNYSNDPTDPDPAGKWYLVLDASAPPFLVGGAAYTSPVFFWETACTPGGPQPASCFPNSPTSTPTAAPSAPSLACTPTDPPVGTTVTCDVSGAAPSIDILWRATAADAAIGSAGVRTADDGTGSFSFVVPRSAAGQRLLVELVEWTRPLDVGVVGGPVPTTVPAGEGGPMGTALLLGIAALAGAVLAVGRGRRDVRASLSG